MIKKTLLISSLGCGLVLLVILLVYPIVNTGRPRWPKINDPNQFIVECSKLMASNGEISKSKWPESLKALNPKFVSAHVNYLKVTLSGGGIDSAWGFLIYPDKRTVTTAPRGLVLNGRVNPGVFKYETSE
jgi:hypothetical protein